MYEEESRELREEILKGLEISYQKLLRKKKQDNAELVFLEDEQIKTVKAVDI